MGIDVHVRCTCFQDGKAKPHPIAAVPRYNKVYGPYPKPSATLEQSIAHDKWFDRSCRHHGYAASARLGNSARTAHIRDEVSRIERLSHRYFRVLTKKVIYSGTHCGDYIRSPQAATLLKELVALATLTEDSSVKEFVATLAPVCRASVRTGNPIEF